VAVLALGACGRIGFDAPASGTDAPNDAPAAYVEPMGRLDLTFGTGGQLVLGSAAEEHAHDVLRRPNGGYLVSGFRRNGAITTFELIARIE